MFAPVSTFADAQAPFASAIAVELARAVADVDPALIPAGSITAMWVEFDRIERLAASAKRLLASRVDQAGEWRTAGCANAAEFMALRSGVTIGAARSALETSKALPDLDVLTAALRAGKLSGIQADLIADAATVNPHAERRLIERCGRQSNRELRDACGRAKAQGDRDPEKRRRRIHRKRSLRWRTNTDGSFSISGTGTLEDGEKIINALQPRIDAAFAGNRTAAHHPDRDAYSWDALVDLLQRGSAPPAASANPATPSGDNANSDEQLFDLDDPIGHVDHAPEPSSPNPTARPRALIRIDYSALARGALDPELDEMCDIAGLGPISIPRARDLLGDALVHLVITRGEAVSHITHLGRRPTLAQGLALAWANPTATCAIEGCQRTRLEIDHATPWASDQVTELRNLTPLCGHHHDLKTFKGWRLHRDSETGAVHLLPPDEST